MALADSPARGRFDMVSRVLFQWRQKGVRAIVLTITRTLLYPLVRHHRRLIWEADLESAFSPSDWEAGEQLLVLGPDNIKTEMTPGLRAFLGGETAAAEIAGVGRGDRLFVVSKTSEYLAYSYIFFDTTRETRRQARILGETQGTPIIGLSYTSPSARGRGLYRRILNDMFLFLKRMGHTRAVCEVDPGNLPSNKASQAAGMHICRELSDWTVLNRLLLQKAREAGSQRWRILWIS